jgi:hypothetical protein
VDVKYLITVNADGAHKAVQVFDESLNHLAGQSGKTEAAHKGLWKEVALGQFAYDAAKKAGKLFLDFMKESVGAAADAEKSDKALSAALEITGRPVKALAGHFKEFAASMQNATIYEDDQVKKAQALLIQLTNLDRDGIDVATKGAIGLASVMGIDLESAASVVAKAMTGNTGALGRYGIKVDETSSKEAQRAAILEKLEQFYVRATSEADTYGGRLAKLKNSYGEMQETVGAYVTENYALADSMKWLSESLKNVLNIKKDYSEQDEKQRNAENQMIDLLSKAASATNMKYGAMQKLIEAHKGEVMALGVEIAQGKEGLPLQEAFRVAYNEQQIALKKLADEQKKAEKGNNDFRESKKKAVDISKNYIENLRIEEGSYESLSKAQMVFGEDLGDIQAKFLDAVDAAEQYDESMAGMGDTAAQSSIEQRKLGNASTVLHKLLDENKISADEFRKAMALLGKVSAQEAKDMPKEWQNALKNFMNKWGDTIAAVQQMLGALDSFYAASYAKKQARIDADYAKTTSKIDKEYAAKIAALDAIDAAEAYQNQKREIMSSNMTEAEKAAALATLETERAKAAERLRLEEEYENKKAAAEAAYEAKSEAIRIAAAKKQRALSISMAIISTAQAIASAATTVPFIPMGLIAAALAAAMGAVQIATIKAQPLAKGAIFKQPTILPGLGGQNYEVAEPGSGGVEIVATPSNIRKAIGLDGRGRPIIIHNHLYLDGKPLKEFIIRTVEQAGANGRLSIARKAVA